MLTLYALLGAMLLCAIIILVMPFIVRKKLFSIRLYGLMLGLIISSLSLYLISGDKVALAEWFVSGRAHYALLEQFEQLGGVKGAIAKIEERLKAQPNDAKGWMILGKLYLSIQDNTKAKTAFEHAAKLSSETSQQKS